MSNKQHTKDLFLQVITYLAAFLSIVTLSLIVFYVTSNGIKLLNIDLIRNNYQAVNHIADIKEDVEFCYCEPTKDLPSNVYYSTKWGLGVIDDKDLMGKNIIEVYYVHPDSPFRAMYDKGVGTIDLELTTNTSIIRIAYEDQASSLSRFGASRLIDELNQSNDIRELEFTTPGGGIRGSIITTLYLIGLTLLFALPIGVGAALYLNEFARKNKFTHLVRSFIETLTGVPSIIYGLMGLAIFVPFIVNITDATGGNIISGAMTLAVIQQTVYI